MQLSNFNPFSDDFLKFNKEEREKIEQVGEMSVGEGTNDKAIIGDVWLNNITPGGKFDTMGISFGSWFESKLKRIQQYREMANYPEISSAIHMICDEAINENNIGDFVDFDIKDTEGIKRKTVRDLREEWDIIINELFNFRETGWDLFKCFLVDAELYFEIVLNEDKSDIIAFKQLPAFTMTPIYLNGEIVKYIQQTDEGAIMFEANQILYINYGEFGDDKTDVRGYLDPCIAIYNMIRNLEDSAVIAQIVRAPERRVFNIEVGKVPNGKAEQILQKTMQNYRKNLRFDPTTGLLSAGERFQAMTEDFFFAKSEGQGSTVETLQSGQNLEQLIELPNYFLRKLYKSLHIPSTRWNGGVLAGASENGHGQYSNKMEIEREELNFTKFIERLSRKFCKLFYKAYIFDLSLKKFDPKLIAPFNYTIKMISNNQYREFREMELLKEKLDMITSYGELRMSAENPNGIFADEYFMKNIVGFTQSQLDLNEEMKKEQKDQDNIGKKSGDAQFGDEFDGDFGGGFGEVGGSEVGGGAGGEPGGGAEVGGGPEGGAGGGETGGEAGPV